jgi:hypothetical protein
VLDRLSYDSGEFLGIGWKPVGHRFRAEVCSPESAIMLVFKHLPEYAAQACFWFSLNPTSEPTRDKRERLTRGRGTSQDATRLAALVLDCDVKPGAFESLEQIEAFIGVLSELIGTRPTLRIYSGHGIQPIWTVDCFLLARWGPMGPRPDKAAQARAKRLLRRFGEFATGVAMERFGTTLDPVYDLARMARVPRTMNWKDPRRAVEVYAVADSGESLSVDRFEELLDELGVPETDAGGGCFVPSARLIDHSYLARLPAFKPTGGRPASPRYKVHPLAAQAAKHAKA